MKVMIFQYDMPPQFPPNVAIPFATYICPSITHSKTKFFRHLQHNIALAPNDSIKDCLIIHESELESILKAGYEWMFI